MTVLVTIHKKLMSSVDWCDPNHLVLNVTTTKEMVSDFRKQTKVPDLTVIKEKDVERVDTFKYLGVMLDNKLPWKQNTDSIVKKTKPCLYCLRKLQTFNVNNTILQLFCTSIVSSTITFKPSQNTKGRNKTKIVKTASMVTGKEQEVIGSIYEHRMLSKMKKILNNKTLLSYLCSTAN